MNEDYDDNDEDRDHEDCGRWDQSEAGGRSQHCRLAGTEDCQFCPYRHRHKD